MKINVKSKITKVICIFVFSACCLIMGLIFSYLADANKGIQAGLSVNGQIVSQNSGYGGNARKYKQCSNIATGFYIGSGVFFIGGIAYAVFGKKTS